MNYPQTTQINADYKNVFYFNLRNLRNLRINLFVGISNDIGDTSLKPVELGAAAALADGRYRQKPNRSHRHTPMNALSLSFGYPPVGARDSIRLSDSTAGGLDDGVLSVESRRKHEESNAGQD